MLELITKAGQDKLEAAIRQAGRKLLEFWPGNTERSGELAVQIKQDGSPVTAADLASNQIILAALREQFPSDPVMSEELPEKPVAGASGRLWVLDPLDGTKPFIAGLDRFCILLALCVNGLAELGFIYAPAREIFVRGQRPRGLYCSGKELHVSKAGELRPGKVYCKARGALEHPCFTDNVSDHCEAYLLLCQGELDAVVAQRGNCSDWDLAAPAAVIEACGGIMTDESGQRLLFGQGRAKSRFVVISNGQVHTEILELVSRIGS